MENILELSDFSLTSDKHLSYILMTGAEQAWVGYTQKTDMKKTSRPSTIAVDVIFTALFESQYFS